MAMKHVRTPESFVGDLAQVVYTAENIERARQYVRTRGLNPDLFNFPWAQTDDNAWPYEPFRDLYPPVIFTNCLYIPVTEISSGAGQPVIAGWDIRYQADEGHRLRWSKRKRTQDTALVYNSAAVLKGDAIIVTEGAMDAESFRTCGWEAMAALTALKTPRFVHFLYACASRVYLAFDNDDDGKKATKWILEYAAQFPTTTPVITPLIYPMKDPSKFLESVGPDAFRQNFAYQLAA